jgi:hypothetical protein
MDTSLWLLQSQQGRCPSCGQLILDADRPPQTPREWEQRLAVTRKAMTRYAITSPSGPTATQVINWATSRDQTGLAVIVGPPNAPAGDSGLTLVSYGLRNGGAGHRVDDADRVCDVPGQRAFSYRSRDPRSSHGLNRE